MNQIGVSCKARSAGACRILMNKYSMWAALADMAVISMHREQEPIKGNRQSKTDKEVTERVKCRNLFFPSCLQNYTIVAAAETFPLDKRSSGCRIFHCGDQTTLTTLALPCGQQAMRSGQSQVALTELSLHYLDRSPLKGIKSPVFRQFNIHCISEGQADSAALPRQTYGIRLKGSSFLRRPSSLNFLRSRYERALFKKVLPLSKSLDSVETLLPFTLRVV